MKHFIPTILFCIAACGGGQTVQTQIETLRTETSRPTGFFPTKQGAVAYWISGKGETLFLLHSAGPGHEHRDFDAILPELSRSYRVIAVDWPGHGASELPNPPDSASAVLYAETLPSMIETLSPNGAILIGNSLGGFAAMKTALDNPNLVKGLVLVDSGGMNEPDFKTKVFVKLMSALWFTKATWNSFPEYYVKIDNEYTRSILSRIRERKSAEGSVNVRAAIWKSFSDERHDLRERVSSIRTPTLIVWGKNDPVIFPEFGEKLRGKIPGSKLVFLNTGHVPFAEDPQGFLAALHPFLRSVYGK
ncbi:alpha/beta hydrolase [Leptospira ellisii]|uniref:Alpha/beta hydrolase n=1 Tax=Leptospira ellisii TaxID=2023197 RepID=A0A2N0BJP6_9LEPT|nr:alpha/beta hydrolase [Leptospira ellisii]MDV6237278.1 alpha/beta hydrolase [Leptospira ellisii]PJZ93927.1 alpha/beta hydrolase [Leptospira ellisii]PKA04227.1 alpha/beta hydrolase [Leptospira ellisii]